MSALPESSKPNSLSPRLVHAIRIYESDEGLARLVVPSLAQGLRQEETVLVVATASHLATFMAGLKEVGLDPEARSREGQLSLLEARKTLDLILEGDSPSRAKFGQVIGEALTRASRWRPEARLLAYGEMVDILWQEGRLGAALQLEECWQELMKRRPFSLICGYRMSLFGPEGDLRAIEKVCSRHTELLSTSSGPRLKAAVDRAMESVLGSARASLLAPLIAADLTLRGLDRAEKTMCWVRRNLPALAEVFLVRVRQFYEAGK
jgi:hypothetical protein